MAEVTQEQHDLGMGFIDINPTDVPDLVLLDDGEQHLRFVAAQIKESKGEKTAGQRMLNLRFESTEVPNSADIYQIYMLPSDEETEKNNIRRMNDIKKALDALGVPYDASGFRPADFIGKEIGRAHV